MIDLDHMDLGKRVMLTVAIVLAALGLIALVGYLSGGWDDAQGAPVPPSKWDSRLIELDKDALDKAYVAQMGHIFEIWIKDGVADSSRATRGFANARKGYNAAMSEIEQRQRNEAR